MNTYFFIGITYFSMNKTRLKYEKKNLSFLSISPGPILIKIMDVSMFHKYLPVPVYHGSRLYRWQ